jgi:hypothetical protein
MLKNKYIKYKNKYIALKNIQLGGEQNITLSSINNTYVFNFTDNTITHNINNIISKCILLTNLSQYYDSIQLKKSFIVENSTTEKSGISFYKNSTSVANYIGSFTIQIIFENDIFKILHLYTFKMPRYKNISFLYIYYAL